MQLLIFPVWQQQGKQKEARRELAEIYGWFTEGFDTKHLQEAKTLLAELNDIDESLIETVYGPYEDLNYH